MFAVERAPDGFGNRSGAETFGQHCSPRDRLQDDPVRPNRGQYRENRERMAKSLEHA